MSTAPCHIRGFLRKAALCFLGAAALLLLPASLPAAEEDWRSDYFDWRLTEPTDRKSAVNPLPIMGPIRNQGKFEACWTFGSLASYESSWARQLEAEGLLKADTKIDFSERYLAWTTYAAPLEEPGDSTPRHILFWDRDYERGWEAKIYNQGGYVYMAKNSMLVNGAALESQAPYESNSLYMAGVARRLAPSGLLHDVYSPVLLGQIPVNQDEKLFQRVKQLIAENGAVVASYYHDNDPAHFNRKAGEIYNWRSYALNHVIALVGWDDEYEFTTLKHADGTALTKGAWLLRNSWGDSVGQEGYFYISYEDTTLGELSFFNAELDSGRYSSADGHFGWTHSSCAINFTAEGGTNRIAVASALRSGAHQMVKALSFFASNPSMGYEITIRSGSTPGQGSILGRQSGAFGSDGTSSWEGWRTVDLDSFVFLPEGAAYVVEVTTSNADPAALAQTYIVLTSDGGESASPYGRSYYYDFSSQRWFDVGQTVEAFWGESFAYFVVDLAARGKDSNQPNGGDFSVSWLDDGGVGGSVIDLGKTGELYKTDALSADRRTLSNMTVSLDLGVTNNYGGSITGEGAVIKTGEGFLGLSGTSDYSGGTRVEAGTLAVNGSLASSVDVSSGARLQGNGTILSAVANEGAVAPGNSIGTLTVGSYSGGGTLELEGNALGGDLLIVKGSAVVKKVNFVPLGYFADGTTALKLADFLQAGSPDTAGVVITGTTRETATVTITTDKQSGESFSFITTRAANAYSSLGNSAGGTAAGRALDQAAGKATGDGAVLVGTIDFLSAQGVAAALDQLHPEAYDSLLYSAMDNSHRLSGMIADRMTSRNVPTGYKMNWYFQPFGTISRQNDWGGYGGFKSQSSGVLIGGEKRRGDWTLGVHGGFIHDGTSVWAASPLSSTSDGGFIGLQAKRAADPEKGLFLYGLARVGWDRYETTRSVALSDSCRENGAKWTGFSGAVEIGAGWNHK